MMYKRPLVTRGRRPTSPLHNPRHTPIVDSPKPTGRSFLRAYVEESIQTVLGVDVFLGLAIAADADADVAVLGSMGGPGSGDFESWVVAEFVDCVGDLGVALFAAGLVGAGVDDGDEC